MLNWRRRCAALGAASAIVAGIPAIALPVVDKTINVAPASEVAAALLGAPADADDAGRATAGLLDERLSTSAAGLTRPNEQLAPRGGAESTDHDLGPSTPLTSDDAGVPDVEVAGVSTNSADLSGLAGLDPTALAELIRAAEADDASRIDPIQEQQARGPIAAPADPGRPDAPPVAADPENVAVASQLARPAARGPAATAEPLPDDLALAEIPVGPAAGIPNRSGFVSVDPPPTTTTVPAPGSGGGGDPGVATTTPATTTTTTTTVPPAPSPLARDFIHGLYTRDLPGSFDTVNTVNSWVGHDAEVLQWYDSVPNEATPPRVIQEIASRGLPMLTLEPWVANSRSDQPSWALRTIIRGDHDDDFRRWARNLAEADTPVIVRFAHEMNGFWFPWSEVANGNSRGEYIQAFRHVHDLFDAEGADDVIWMWSINVGYFHIQPLAGIYPGDDIVDVIGISGYNGGSDVSWGGWLDPVRVFEASVLEVEALTSRPIMLAETASSPNGGDRPEWALQLYRWAIARPSIRGVLWFHGRSQAMWYLDQATAAAIGQALDGR